MTREGFAFAIVSDPYTRDDKIPNVPHSITVFHAPIASRVMLLARAPRFDLFLLYISQHVVALDCDSAGQAFAVVATYGPPHPPLDPILEELSQCFSRYSSSNFILAGDFNAKHVLWDLLRVIPAEFSSLSVRVLTMCGRCRTPTRYPTIGT
ncbi:hypothetical protein HPB49_024300 [Dermacentor silvarum]|uniref:Uncharacterized protein n=1 Tax=Dermacentor silvarum TaxID=543639 RepID=A0ACB8C636_DERSI|nr:hypothetical protein HPB49_024300 [Dermacentor silvarum]